jgi:hypothetical protein
MSDSSVCSVLCERVCNISCANYDCKFQYAVYEADAPEAYGRRGD